MPNCWLAIPETESHPGRIAPGFLATVKQKS
jgi:hypothetical protein